MRYFLFFYRSHRDRYGVMQSGSYTFGSPTMPKFTDVIHAIRQQVGLGPEQGPVLLSMYEFKDEADAKAWSGGNA